jgi:hypothetical protein
MKTIAYVALIALAAGCGGTTKREPDEYTGCGSDENWRTFDDQESTAAVVADATAPMVTAPPAGASIPFAQKIKLTWQQDPNDAGAPDGDVPYMGPGCVMCCPEFNLGSLGTLHLPPISGDVYDLQFTVGGKVAWRVVTTLQEWTPPDATWSSWKGKSVSLKLWRMSVLRNDVKQGPYVGTQPFTFSVGS